MHKYTYQSTHNMEETIDVLPTTYICLQPALQVLCVTVPPKISPFAFQMDLHLGNRAGVQCLVTNGDLPLTIEWRKDWGPLDSDVNVQQLGEFTSSLSIESLRPHHAGNYTCLATNSAAQASHSSRLLVNGNQPLTSFSHLEFPHFVSVFSLGWTMCVGSSTSPSDFQSPLSSSSSS